ncbi:MAG: site-specific integrase, partial [Syntrophaceae bacterium]|nr:site-specific integrase [Syntrophaceae bacterium]
MNLENAIEAFRRHLETEKMRSSNTVKAYMNDLNEFKDYLGTLCQKGALRNIGHVDKNTIRGFLAKKYGRIAKASAGRKLAAIRSFFKFLVREGVLVSNPAASITSPKKEKALPRSLNADEMDRFFSRNSDAFSRDVAIFELLYSTGIRVGELVSITLNDIDLQNGWVRGMGKGSKERYVPVGSKALE